jgi:hypothetical protein
MGEWRYSSTYSEPLHEMEVNGHRHVPTSTPREGPEGTVGLVFGLDVLEEREILTPVGTRAPDCLSRRLVTLPTILPGFTLVRKKA